MEETLFGGMDAFSLSVGDITPFVPEGQPEEVDFDKPEDVIDEDIKLDNIITEDEGPEGVGDDNVDKDDGNGDGQDDSSSSNIYSSLASFVHEQGLLPSFDIESNKITNIDEFTAAMRVEQEAQAKLLLDDYISNLNLNEIKESKSILDSVEGVDENYLKSNIEDAKELIRYDFKAQGLSDNQINRIVDRLVDLGDEDVINEAMNAVVNIKEIQSKKIQESIQTAEREKANRIAENEKIQKKIKDTVFETKDLIKGYNPTPALRDKVYKTMTDIVGNDEQGNPENKFMSDRRKDPIGFETKMYYIYELTNGFTDLSKLGVASKSKAINELERAVRDTVINDTSKPSFLQDNQSYMGGRDFRLNI